ncbi:MAG: hypothetical protein IJ320_05700 [Phascolarctobacterium sp.]|nr:hypothetical protein [Phascolarctobacterium sp.]
MAKKTNKYAGFQAVEDVTGIGAYIGLGRPIDLEDNTTRIALVGALLSMAAVTAWLLTGNIDVMDAAMGGVGVALAFLFSFMLAQELDPDRKLGGIIGGFLTLVATLYLGEGNIVVMLWLLFVIRMLNRTSGSRHKIGDNVIIIGISGWLGSQGFWLYPLITASVYALETQIPGGYFRSWYLAGLALCTCFFADFNFLVQNLSMVYVWLMCATFVIFLPEIRAAMFTEAKGDRNNKRINPRRLQMAQGVFLMIIVALSYLHGDSQAQSLVPAFMAAIGCGLYLVPALMQKKK